MSYLFDKNWFIKHQSKLLWLLNTPLIKIWFRWVMRIRKFDCPLKKRIDGIAPNNFTFDKKLVLIDHIKLKKGWAIYDQTNRQHRRLRKSCLIEKRIALERTTDFRTHNKFSKRLFYAFYPVWWLAHQWDTLFANRFQPTWNLGFDTLTVYPNADPESVSVDGWTRQTYSDGSGQSWSTIVGATGSAANSNAADGNLIHFMADSFSSDCWVALYRDGFLFDTSDLTSDADISTTTFSIYGNGKDDSAGLAPNVNVYSFSPASNTTLAAGDYDSFGSTAFCNTAISYASWANSYNDFTFNATGRAAVSKTGISKFGIRNVNYDVNNSAPSWASARQASIYCLFAETTGTTNDPKLVVTYSTSTAYTQTCSESLSLTQAFSKSQGFKKSTSESLSLTQSFSKKVGFKKSISDSTSLNDLQSYIVDSYSEINQDGYQGLYNAIYQNFGQSFTAVKGTLDSIKLYLLRTNTQYGGYLTVDIYAHSGNYGTSSLPTGAVLATSDAVNITSVSSSAYGLIEFKFSGANRISLNNAYYCFVIKTDGTDAILRVGYDQTSPTHGGNAFYYNGSSWTTQYVTGLDVCFYVYSTWSIKLSNFKKSFTEALSLSTTLTNVSRFFKSLSDNIGLTDAISNTWRKTIELIETFALSDIVSKTMTFTKGLSESIGLTDAISSVRCFAKELTENLSLSDAVSKVQGLYQTLTESLSLSSLMDRTTNFIKSFSENIGLTDALSSSRIWFANLIENISLTDLIEKVNGYAQTLTESLSLSSLVEKTTSYFKELNDSIGLTDYISNTWLKILNLIESISLSDTLGKTANFIKSFSDGIGLTGTMQRTAKFFKSIKESLSLSSSISFLRKRFLAISENLKLTDSISKITKFFHSLTETVWLSDVVRFAGRFWNKLAKKTSSYTNQSKNSSSWSQATKSTASWNYKDKSP